MKLRPWKTHDLVDLFESTRLGRIFLPSRKFTNDSLIDKDENVPIIQHDVNWPTHMEPDFDKFKPGQFKVEDNIPIPNRLLGRTGHGPYQWEEALYSLKVGKCLTVRMDGTMKEANNLMLAMRNRLNKREDKLSKKYTFRTVKGDGKWKGTVVAVRAWRLAESDEG